jgi:hypothetical protein
MYSTLLQHYLQKHITQDARKPDGFDENDDMFQLLTCCKDRKLCFSLEQFLQKISIKTSTNSTDAHQIVLTFALLIRKNLQLPDIIYFTCLLISGL